MRRVRRVRRGLVVYTVCRRKAIIRQGRQKIEESDLIGSGVGHMCFLGFL